MDYEKKYKDALERARQFSEKPYLEDSKGIVDYIFPELKESEDERIRKWLIPVVDRLLGTIDCPFGCDKVLSWLEKQNEQKPVLTEEQMKVLEEVIRNPHLSTDEYNGLIALKEQLKTQKGESV